MGRLKLQKIISAVLITVTLVCFAVSCENIDIKTITSTGEPDETLTESPNPTASTTSDIVNDGLNIQSKYDEKGRLVEEIAEMYSDGLPDARTIYVKTYEYTEEGYTKSLAYKDGDRYTYGYDAEGRIISISRNDSVAVEYVYNEKGYLISEDNSEARLYCEYSYDENGNIIDRKIFSYDDLENPMEECEYTYENGRLKSTGGSEITYNSLGNPIFYNNGVDCSFTWKEDGRLLESFAFGDAQIRYEYGTYGMRSAKVTDGARYEYTWSGMKLTELRIAEAQGNERKLTFTYSDGGTPVMFTCNDKNYYYKVNISGDVEEVFTEEGEVLRYYYDAWGRIISTKSQGSDDIMKLNPIRYRGYVYDEETELYYLHTRYYDPALGRRLNADGYSVYNAEGYIYGKNDPVGNIDSTMTVKYPVCNELHLYTEKESPVAGKINIIFKPYGANPVFQIENSYKITDAGQQRAILEYIMESDMYSQEIYCRTIESMLTEWKAHNHIFAASPNERCRHVDFDKNDEGISYSDFWKRAAKEYGIELG